MTELESYLQQLEVEIGRIRAALADEHEGKVRAAAFYIEAHAHDVAQLVRSW